MSEFTYISYGAGVQSTALLVMSALQFDRYSCPKADVAIFADTGNEPQWVYDTIDFYDEHFSDRIPITVVRKPKSLLKSMAEAKAGNRFASLPAFTRNSDGSQGIMRRQCTREFKIEVIEKRLTKTLGKWNPKKRAVCLLGISLDEAHRMKPNRRAYITNTFPLIDNRMTRNDCVRFLESLDLPVPRKSACVFCPFHSDAYWLDIKRNYPKEWIKAVGADRLIRNMSKQGTKNPLFLHRTMVPLDQVKFRHENQADMFGNECEGACGI